MGSVPPQRGERATAALETPTCPRLAKTHRSSTPMLRAAADEAHEQAPKAQHQVEQGQLKRSGQRVDDGNAWYPHDPSGKHHYQNALREWLALKGRSRPRQREASVFPGEEQDLAGRRPQGHVAELIGDGL